MYIIYFIYVVIYPTVFCELQRLEDGTLLEDFVVVNKGHMHYPTILMYIEELTISECADTCRRHLRCVTFNYNWNTRACELVDQIFDELEAGVDDPNWYNYGTPDKTDGGWSNWFEGSTCSATCGYGLQTQYRTCTAPEPKYGGAPCIGNEVQTVSCKIVLCPIDGGFSSWKKDGKCTVTCGGGILKQKMTCTNPPPLHGGKDCGREPTRTVVCNTKKCPPACVMTTLGGCCKFPYGHNGKLHFKCWAWSGKYVCYDTAGAFRTCAKAPN